MSKRIRIMKRTVMVSLMVLSAFFSQANTPNLVSEGWMVGVAKADITPQNPMWLAGYASRTQASEGAMHSLWAKCLFFQDAKGNSSALITLDVVGISGEFGLEVRRQISRKTSIPLSNILINCSHTHSGPVLDQVLSSIYPLKESDKREIVKYSAWLKETLIALCLRAHKDLEPVKLYAKNGVSRIQVNRRTNQEKDIDVLKELKGPNDFAVPTIKVESNKGHLKAIVFGYACHPTVLSGYQWSGDYAGFAQLELEKLYPATTALFFQGAGGDQNPLPRRTIPLAKQYGKSLAAAVERVLNEEMTPLAASFKSSAASIKLELTAAPSLSELKQIQKEAGQGYIYEWSSNLIEQYEAGKPLLRNYPNYPIQVWDLGGQKIISLGGEITIGYAVKLKEKYGDQIFVMGYTNDVMGYIPTESILEEGGYEGDTSQRAYGLPSKWASGIESQILLKVQDLMEAIN